MTTIIDGRWMCIQDDILSAKECANFIEDLDKSDELEIIDRGFAFYERSILISPTWASTIRQRILHILPEEVRNICIINDHFRFSKYTDGGYFNIHRDGVNIDNEGNYAIFTINIFLNDTFNGGVTEFFNADELRVVSAIPSPGRGAIFDNKIYHCGTMVSGGIKYLLRTDVLIPRQKGTL